MRIKHLVKHIGIYALGNIALRSASFFLIPIYTHYLSIKNYGVLEICLITIQICMLFMGLGMRQSLVRFYKEHELKNKIGSLYSTSVTINILGIFLLLLLILPFKHHVSQLIFNKDQAYILILICLVSSVQSLTHTSLSFYRARNQAFIYSISGFLIMGGLIGLNIYLVIILKKGVIGILYGYLIIYSAAAILINVSIFLKYKLLISWKISKKIISFGLPLILSMAGWFIIHMSSRYFLSYFKGLQEVGIYGLGYRIVNILQIVIVMPFQLAYGPYIFTQEKNPELKKNISIIFTYLLFILLLSVWGIALASRSIIKIIAPHEYNQAYIVVLLLLPSIIALGIYYWAASLLHLVKKTKLIALFIGGAALINIILNLYFIPKYGWYGAAISTNLSIFLAMVLTLYFGLKFYKIQIEKERLKRIILAFTILYTSLAISFNLPYIYYYLLNVILFIISITLLYNSKLLYKNEKDYIKNVLARIDYRKDKH